jgi:hypothetical protein
MDLITGFSGKKQKLSGHDFQKKLYSYFLFIVIVSNKECEYKYVGSNGNYCEEL